MSGPRRRPQEAEVTLGTQQPASVASRSSCVLRGSAGSGRATHGSQPVANRTQQKRTDKQAGGFGSWPPHMRVPNTKQAGGRWALRRCAPYRIKSKGQSHLDQYDGAFGSAALPRGRSLPRAKGRFPKCIVRATQSNPPNRVLTPNPNPPDGDGRVVHHCPAPPSLNHRRSLAPPAAQSLLHCPSNTRPFTHSSVPCRSPRLARPLARYTFHTGATSSMSAPS